MTCWATPTTRRIPRRTPSGSVSARWLFLVALFALPLPTVALLIVPPPLMGIAALLFPVRRTRIAGVSQAQGTNAIKVEIADASDFFVDAFWTAKVGGGAAQLSKNQQSQLRQSQTAEFTRRYGSKRRASELFVCRDGQNAIVACVGVEMGKIPDGYLQGPTLTKAPLMSNLAVSRSYRRRGLAEQLVRVVEQHVQDAYGADECFLYVEQRNRGAVKLYQKLGYRQVWVDDNAQTLLPTARGDLQSASTTIVCMKKNVVRGNGIFSGLFG
ncbi:predicted protein [Phaeodactylum tricornutum CCAP 1055/1]|uniref:N-acetyltransferase domain-containing protein n=1 Tax=Phaeodactylum tricornutum (strain CCAP 1055/1) TaxID=556484 RepID=B7GEB6_PHATC|nr:predicted protein [Phaeodactylum tricornutum CCAP 1055/1]EEC43075.1 predicted protein [Phaeodactylum tricornutum CCAP 1055/1]|eukprot:XP_002185406.1 predicted protein [Phaeodactylum tricornutum CCAP 1055/1]